MPATTPNRGYPYPIGTDPVDVAGDVRRLATALDTDVAALNAEVGPTPWIAATLVNGWENFLTGRPPTQYRKVGDMVQVRGCIKRPTPLANLEAAAFAQLPAGYRPAYDINPLCVPTGPTSMHGAASYMAVQVSGQLVAFGLPDTTPHLFMYFDIEFSVTPLTSILSPGGPAPEGAW